MHHLAHKDNLDILAGDAFKYISCTAIDVVNCYVIHVIKSHSLSVSDLVLRKSNGLLMINPCSFQGRLHIQVL